METLVTVIGKLIPAYTAVSLATSPGNAVAKKPAAIIQLNVTSAVAKTVFFVGRPLAISLRDLSSISKSGRSAPRHP